MATVNKNLSEYNSQNVPNADSLRFGIVVSEWNQHITGNLLKGAIQAFKENGAKDENITIWHVPGSYELIYGSNQMAKTQNVDAVLAIGSVIQGETKHFDFVCEAVSQGIKDINILTDTPAIFCLLTDHTEQQAIDRSGGKHGNKGVECAIAAIQMADLKKKLGH
ncbi:6,7-dimethyl-8-ribityllumazine synthase [Flavobacteriaceae bacterium UJ101]|nr:6,7-dimethyl-8-ribityllumazine synthase [Flavobacteriaceae bacterium UJ101]